MNTESEEIKQSFLSGIISTRARGGLMDEKNHESFYKIGINSGSAQHEILSYFKQENEFYAQSGLLPNLNDTVTFLNQMAYKYAGCSVFVKNLNETIMFKGERSNEKNESNADGPKSKSISTAIVKRVQHADQLHVSRSEEDKNSVGRTFRPESGKTKSDKRRGRSVSRQQEQQQRKLLKLSAGE